MPGFWSLSFLLHYIVLAKLATSSKMVETVGYDHNCERPTLMSPLVTQIYDLFTLWEAKPINTLTVVHSEPQ